MEYMNRHLRRANVLNQNKYNNTVPRPLKRSIESPVIVMLTPEVDDPMYANCWQRSFDRCAPLFKSVGAQVIAAPWSTTPLPTDYLYSYVYIANLTWGYHFVPDRWYKWLGTWPKKARLINSVKIITWNTEKTYLQDLESRGVAVIPTLNVNIVNEKTLINAAAHFSTNDLIIKPQVSACSYRMLRVHVNCDNPIAASKSISVSEAVTELRRIHASHSAMMIQPFMPSICTEGEISVLVFRGKISHVVQKKAKPDDYRVQAQHGGIFTTVKQPTSEMRELTHAAIAACPERPVYARVDMVREKSTGRLCVIEMELIEPDLYLDHMSDGGLAFTRAIIETISDSS